MSSNPVPFLPGIVCKYLMTNIVFEYFMTICRWYFTIDMLFKFCWNKWILFEITVSDIFLHNRRGVVVKKFCNYFEVSNFFVVKVLQLF